jgi:hypothetical protein
VLPLDGRRQRLDAAVQVVAIPADLGATDPPRVVLPAVSAVVGRDDGLDVLVLGADLEDVTRPRALWARFSEKGAQQAVVELTHPELGGWPRRWLHPWPGAKRRVAIAATRADAQARADTGVDVLEVVAP